MKHYLTCSDSHALSCADGLKQHNGGFLKKLRFAMLLLCVVCMQLPALAQNITIHGVVTDETDEPLIGASVQIKGTNNGVTTNIDGEYSIPAPKDATLVVSYVGYDAQEIKVNGRTEINIKMATNATMLDEVVAVGYGTMKKSDLTGAVASVSTDMLNAKGAPSVLENLQGTTPGVNITKSTGRTNGSVNIEIRGQSSINSTTTPLFVVDGVICSDIDFLNPQDIERVDILKDASSTAIYGSRASAGVVIVTTKGGSTVKKDTKASITYDGYYGINKASRLPEFSDGMQYYQQRFRKLQENTFFSNTGSPFATFANQTVFGQALLQESTSDFSSPFILKEMLANGQTYDWPGLVINDGHQQNHYVAISGASDTANYHFGVGYNEEEGIYKGDNSQMYNFKGSVDARVNKVISAGFNFNLAYIKNSYADDGGVSDAYRANCFNIPFDENGRINNKPGAKEALGTDGNQFTDQVSPLLMLRNSKQMRKTYRALGNVYLQLDIIKGLNLKTNFSPSYSQYRHGYFAGYPNPDNEGYTYAGKDLDEAGHNSTNIVNKTSFGWTWDNTINFNRTFNDIHSVNFMGLISLEKSSTEEYKVDATDVREGVDWWNIQSGTLNSVDEDGKAVTTSSYGESSMVSYALRANYGFKDRYMLTATVRWDGSSKFGQGRRWGTFPSFALAWRASEEKFLQNDWLSNLKLRVSYGISGNNRGIGNYDTMVGIGGPVFYPFGSDYYQGFYPGSVADANLHWEKSYEYNGGIDFGFLNSRITGSIDIYQKDSKELLYEVQLPLEAGGGKMKTNIGKVRNRGVEIALTTVNFTNHDWEWTTTFTFAHNSNKVRQINGVADKYIKNADNSLFVGRSIAGIYEYDWAGIVTDKMMTVPDHEIAKLKGFNPGDKVKMSDYYYACYGLQEGNPYVRDVNGDGTIDDEDKVIFNGEPKWNGSLTSNLSYRLPGNGGMFDFSFNIYTKQGFKVYSSFLGGDLFRHDQRARNTIAVDNYMPAGAMIDAEGMRADGTFVDPTYMTYTNYGDYPTMGTNSSMGAGKQMSFWNSAKKVTSGSFTKVKNITLGYTFNRNILSKIGCQNLRLYCTIANPFVWSKYKGFDPEWASAAGKNDGPSIVSYQFGASIKF